MESLNGAVRLRCYVGEYDNHGPKPVFECILEAARKHGLAGATVIRGQSGFGERIYKSAIRSNSSGLAPVIVEIVDREEKLTSFLSVLDAIMETGLVTRDSVRALRPKTAKTATGI